MSLEVALQGLSQPTNAQINWAIGDLLRVRATRDDWLDCPILRQLNDGEANAAAWNALFGRTRNALANENDLPAKARVMLSPHVLSFDSSLEDFVAEMIAVLYLANLGHHDIQFPTAENPISADLCSECQEIKYITEVKNLREPRSLAYVAFARWHARRSANPEAYNFTVEFLEFDDPFEDLTPDQAVAVCRLVDDLSQIQRPSTFWRALPQNRRLRVRITDGTGMMMHHGSGPFEVTGIAEECEQNVILKLLEPMKKAISQLYSNAVPGDARKLLFVRWKPPDEIVSTGEVEGVRAKVLNRAQGFIQAFFPNFAMTITHTYEEIEDAPNAVWH